MKQGGEEEELAKHPSLERSHILHWLIFFLFLSFWFNYEISTLKLSVKNNQKKKKKDFKMTHPRDQLVVKVGQIFHTSSFICCFSFLLKSSLK